MGKQPDLYRFFASQPKDIMIASLSEEADNLPTFARRSVLINNECAVPFHPTYYQQTRQRGFDLMHAQYSGDLAVVQRFIRERKIDFLLLDRTAFSPRYVKKNHLIKQFKDISTEIADSLEKGSVPALEKLSDTRYVAFSNEKSIVFDAKALLSASVPTNEARVRSIAGRFVETKFNLLRLPRLSFLHGSEVNGPAKRPSQITKRGYRAV